MARPVRGMISMQNISSSSTAISSFCLLVAIFAVFSIVSFLCASHKSTKPKRSQQESTHKKLVSNLNNNSSNFSSKALLMAKMISWKKIQVEEEEEEENDEAVWKKSIIMGEKCRPLDFSGKIVYDSQGNLVPDSEPDQKNTVCLGKS